MIAGGVAVGGFSIWWTRAKTPPAPALKYLTYSGHDFSPAVSPDGKTVTFTSDRDGAPANLAEGSGYGSRDPCYFRPR